MKYTKEFAAEAVGTANTQFMLFTSPPPVINIELTGDAALAINALALQIRPHASAAFHTLKSTAWTTPDNTLLNTPALDPSSLAAGSVTLIQAFIGPCDAVRFYGSLATAAGTITTRVGG